MAKKSSKSKAEVIATPVVSSEPIGMMSNVPKKHENIKDFLKRKLATYGKFKQTMYVPLIRLDDFIRCSLCNSIVLWAADIVFEDDHTHKTIKIKGVCETCLKASGVKVLNDDELAEVAEKEKSGFNKKMVSKDTSWGQCTNCGVEDSVYTYFARLDGMPVKLYYCIDCVPTKSVKPSVAGSIDMVKSKFDAAKVEEKIAIYASQDKLLKWCKDQKEEFDKFEDVAVFKTQ